MKKVKIMLLSLALFAIVGGALAFKAKFELPFCTTDAFFNVNGDPQYYCSYSDLTGSQTTYTSCLDEIQEITPGTGVKKVCTTITDPVFGCTDGTPAGNPTSCPVKTSVDPD